MNFQLPCADCLSHPATNTIANVSIVRCAIGLKPLIRWAWLGSATFAWGRTIGKSKARTSPELRFAFGDLFHRRVNHFSMVAALAVGNHTSTLSGTLPCRKLIYPPAPQNGLGEVRASSPNNYRSLGLTKNDAAASFFTLSAPLVRQSP